MFCCVLNLDGEAVSPEVRARYAGRMRVLAEGDAVEEVDAGAFVAWVVPARVPLRPLWARRGGRVAVGNVRLDDPEEVRRWGGTREREASSLELVLDAFDALGESCITRMLGDFALLVYDPREHRLVAARDAFGVKTLFTRETGHLALLSSHLELVHGDEAVDEQFVADFLLGGNPGPERTIWADSRAVAQGSILRYDDGKRTAKCFWTPYDHLPADQPAGKALEEQFRVLFADAVRARVAPGGVTWAELSGGLDSSSVVCMAHAQTISGRGGEGLGGTVTIVDQLGSADEREFSNAVIDKVRIRNELIPNPWAWQDDGREPPRTDEPRVHYPYFARDRMECELVRAHGGRVLLSGMGSDHYLYGNRLYIAGMVAQGHLIRVAQELARWSIAEKRSFWRGSFQDGLLPFAPVALQRRYAPTWDRVPPWIEPDFARRTDMGERLQVSRTLGARPAQRFGWSLALAMEELTRWLPRGPFEEGIELRYPFLSRPLVEFSMHLAPETRIRPLASKWILRRAMRGVLPELIRSRPGKGAIDARILWSLTREQSRVREILSASHLISLGIVRGGCLSDSVEEARQGRCASTIVLLAALSLDTWFWVRSGRWKVRGPASSASAQALLQDVESSNRRR
jgi:asparagine synthase (glutamine-hydrolysing)